MADFFRKLFDNLSDSGKEHPLARWRDANPFPVGAPQTDPASLPAPITRKVLMITHNPALKTQGGRNLKEYFRWQDPDVLAQGYIDEVRREMGSNFPCDDI